MSQEVEFNAENIVRKRAEEIGKKVVSSIPEAILNEFEKDRVSNAYEQPKKDKEEIGRNPKPQKTANESKPLDVEEEIGRNPKPQKTASNTEQPKTKKRDSENSIKETIQSEFEKDRVSHKSKTEGMPEKKETPRYEEEIGRSSKSKDNFEKGKSTSSIPEAILNEFEKDRVSNTNEQKETKRKQKKDKIDDATTKTTANESKPLDVETEISRKSKPSNETTRDNEQPQEKKSESQKKKEPDQYDYQKGKVESGAAEATQIESDLNELKSGRFFGVLTRKAQTIKKTKDWFKDDLLKTGDKKSEGANQSGVQTAASAINTGIGSANGKKIPLVRVDKLEVLRLLTRDNKPLLPAGGHGGFLGAMKAKFGFGKAESTAITPEVLPPLVQKIPSSEMAMRKNDLAAKQDRPRISSLIIDKALINQLHMRGGGQLALGGGGGGGGLLGNNSSGAGSSAGDKIGTAIGTTGSSLSSGFGGLGVIVGGAVAAAGATMSAISAVAGMHQNVMQEQDRTLDAVGYVGSGGHLTTNAEMAQIQLTRMKNSGSGWDRNNRLEKQDVYSSKDVEVKTGEKGKRYERTGDYVSGVGAHMAGGNGIKEVEYDKTRTEKIKTKTGSSISDNNLDVKFGLSQGIGGSAGAELFSQLNRFSQGSTDNTGRRGIDGSEYKSLITAGVAAGFGGKRQAEFFQGLSGIMKNSVESGFGKLNLEETATAIGSLANNGISSDRAMSVYNSLQGGITQEDGQMNNMVVGALMQNNPKMGYNEAMAKAQEGATKENVEVLKEYLKGYDPETAATIMWKVFRVGSARENSDRAKAGGGILDDYGDKSKLGGGKAGFGDAVGKDLKATDKVGQSYRAVGNEINNVVAGMKEVYKLQQDITKLMLQQIKPLAENGDKTVGSLRKVWNDLLGIN